MILAYEFSGASENLGFFLEFYAKELEYSFLKDDNKLTLFVSGDESKMSEFADILGANVPHFITLKDSKVYVTDEMRGEKMGFKNSLSNITPAQINACKNGEFRPCENGIFSDTSIFVGDKFVAISQENFTELLEYCVKNLADGLMLKDGILGKYHLGYLVGFNDINALMPTSMTHLDQIFYATNAEQIALVSYEKPTLNLKLTQSFRQNLKDDMVSFDALFARDIFIYAFCERLAKNGVKFIGVKYERNFKAIPLEHGICFANSQAYFDKKFSLNDEIFNQNKMSKTLRLFLSKNYHDELKIYIDNTSADVVNLDIFENFEQIFTALKELDNADRLLQNYEREFVLPSGKIDAKNSFFTLFCIAGKILDLDDDLTKSGEKLFQNALDFSGTKGVRIDFKMASKTHFDTLKFIRSILSFRLAGAQAKNISYGILESFVYFLSDICESVKDDFDIQSIVLQGSLFESKILSNLVLKHLNLVVKTHFCEQSVIEI